MPKTDTVFTLENESGGEYKVNYISQRTALSGGWKAFCDSNGLNESDVLVFHLIAPLRFKVPFISFCYLYIYIYIIQLAYKSFVINSNCFSSSFEKGKIQQNL